MPTTKLAAPKRIEMTSPSVWARPAWAKANIKLLSRTPQPAIDTGKVAIKSTGGMRNRICTKLTGEAIALAQHHAAAAVIRWIATEHVLIGRNFRQLFDRWRLTRHLAAAARISAALCSSYRDAAPITSGTARAIGDRER